MNQPDNSVVMPAPARVGQGTVVEQTRAAAEVAAAVQVAQQCPRNIQTALKDMRESCKQNHLASRAFYSYPRGGQTVTGASVHLARELARCWGNVQYGIAELRRDDAAAESEVIAYAWDVQTNTRNSNTFFSPHKRDTKKGVQVLTDMRDIYETNSNNGARRVRECIFAILPPWFVEEAKALCNETLENGGGVPLARRIANSIERFGDLGVSVAQLEQRSGRSSNDWTARDVAQLGILYTSIQRGELRAEDEFAPERVTAEEITGKPIPVPADAPAGEGWPAAAQPGGEG